MPSFGTFIPNPTIINRGYKSKISAIYVLSGYDLSDGPVLTMCSVIIIIMIIIIIIMITISKPWVMGHPSTRLCRLLLVPDRSLSIDLPVAGGDSGGLPDAGADVEADDADADADVGSFFVRARVLQARLPRNGGTDCGPFTPPFASLTASDCSDGTCAGLLPLLPLLLVLSPCEPS
jgi:hypothetical protein